jgi:hypothetical protein
MNESHRAVVTEEKKPDAGVAGLFFDLVGFGNCLLTVSRFGEER